MSEDCGWVGIEVTIKGTISLFLSLDELESYSIQDHLDAADDWEIEDYDYKVVTRE